MVDEFERAINFFHATKNISIFITGSNSRLLSGELATLLSGRYVSFRVMPFRFQEMCEMLGVKKEEASEKELMDYITWGGMPQRFYFKTEEEIKVFMTDLYDSIVLKDITEIGALLENVVYNELLVRGYEVYVGKTTKGEIDFVAVKDEKKEYYQVTYLLATEDVIEREFGAYKDIQDNYPKYVLSMDRFDFSRDGIIHQNIIDFLMER